jgi:hypothetical protein
MKKRCLSHMIRLFQLCIFTLVLSAGGVAIKASAQTDSSWVDPYETDDGIAVCSRRVPESRILEFKAMCVVDVPPSIVFRAAMRRDTYRHTSKYVVDFQIIHSDESNVFYIYQRIGIPLFRDRDYTLRYEEMQDSLHGYFSLVWTIANDKGPPPTEDVVRIEISRGGFEMLPVEEGKKTRLICTICTDPGGNIPGWLVNIGNRSTLPDLLRAIRDNSMTGHDSQKTNEN